MPVDRLRKEFLSAYWRYLILQNYQIDPSVLAPFVPAGTELDSFNGKTFVSVVGFLFQETRVVGIKIPYHVNFEEINLRFYVRYHSDGEWRRGVVFVKEIVPRYWIATIARLLYRENYVALPTCHNIVMNPDLVEHPNFVSYSWKHNNRWQSLSVKVDGEPQPLEVGSNEEFITEHYWGYTKLRENQTAEYQVEHPRWRVWSAIDSEFDCNVSLLYGAEFQESLSQKPDSAFLAEGSGVKVYPGKRIII